MVEAGDTLGTRHMNVLVGRPPGTSLDLDETAAGFAAICDIASQAGMLVGLEFMPFKALATVDVATDIVERAERTNGGLVVDSYHFFRGGSRLDDLAAVPGQRIVTLQLNDVPSDPPADLLVETRTARLLPGEGGLPLIDWLRAISATGTNATVGVEILSDALRELSVDDVARVTFDATRKVLDSAR
jgi:sugar phosphate isomerase/epimerase